MAEILKKLVVDCSTGKEELIPLTAEEIADFEATRAQAEIDRAAAEAESKARAEAKTSALAKLAALGLTQEEVAAIAGA